MKRINSLDHNVDSFPMSDGIFKFEDHEYVVASNVY